MMVVPYHFKKRIVGVDNLPVEIPENYADDVGVDQAPDLRLAFREIAVQTRILQRRRGLRREQLQHDDTARREDARSQVVLEVECSDELGLGDERQGKDRPRSPLANVGILRGAWLAASSTMTASRVRRA